MVRSFLLLMLLGCGPPLAASSSAPTPNPPISDPELGPDLHPIAPYDLPLLGLVAPHNVLILFIDDVGTEQIGAYGEGEDPPPTPAINRLAADGVLFRNAWSQPVCSPARAALLTGRYPRRYGIGWIIDFTNDVVELPTDALTLPRMLQRSTVAWDDAAIGKWHLTNLNQTGPTHPNDCGFSTFRGTLANPHWSAVPSERTTNYFYWEEIYNGVPAFREGYLTSATTDDAIAQIDTMQSPWLLYVPYNAPHKPLHWPPPELHTQDTSQPNNARRMYRAMLEALDTEIGRLLDHVPDNTTVFLIGDNGTAEASIGAPYDADSAKGTLYEGGVNVPFIVTGPLVGQPGSEQAALVHVVDVFPTVAEIAGVDPVALDVDGTSLVPLLWDSAAPGPPYVYNELFEPLGPPPYVVDERAVRGARYKLVRGVLGDELYDLRDRNAEGRDLLADPPHSASLLETSQAYAELCGVMDTLATDIVYDP